MANFNPKTEYTIVPSNINIEDFHKYAEEYVVRPPYQRKTVWSKKKQQDLLDSLFRRYYVPRIVLREVRLNDNRTISEVIDGQQRITTVQAFYRNELPLPDTLKDVHPKLPGEIYGKLTSDFRRFVDRISYQADIVKGVDNPKDPAHQKVATEIFWRLQQGESLTFMEEAHSRLSSLARNFVVKYADDQRFDYAKNLPLDNNPDKHPYFSLLVRKNNRMQHLALLTRLLMIEKSNGIIDIKNSDVAAYIDDTQAANGIGNYSLENESFAKQLLQNLNVLHNIFKNDPMVQDGSGLREFRIEYFIISVYLLLRHLRTHYVFGKEEKNMFRNFVIAFHNRWNTSKQSDTDILLFANNRQQSQADITRRDQIVRQAFFEFATKQGLDIKTKDRQRAFSEAQRIVIYRRDDGLCQQCLAEGKPEKEALVTWKEYEADHIIAHAHGGQTEIDNGQVLCRLHNRQKGAFA